ncbi:hypothetical protein CPB83DRAFT_837217 [Crepidotus variabilis]|uniref:Uncharacterized protein n=1 Tax=Crepidotus variabilis TaxID=179855 RepID=A0A9P6ECJ4_9AGAR|nr:hypothetical protein CPB83DRAFT_837217 [Crepidotus variabilis]
MGRPYDVIDKKNIRTRNHARIGAQIKASRGKTASTGTSIYDLALAILNNSSDVLINVPLCARLALLRLKYTDSSKYWDTVDLQLAEIRDKAANNAVKITRAFTRLLTNDRALYGDETSYTIPEGDDSLPDA